MKKSHGVIWRKNSSSDTIDSLMERCNNRDTGEGKVLAEHIDPCLTTSHDISQAPLKMSSPSSKIGRAHENTQSDKRTREGKDTRLRNRGEEAHHPLQVVPSALISVTQENATSVITSFSTSTSSDTLITQPVITSRSLSPSDSQAYRLLAIVPNTTSISPSENRRAVQQPGIMESRGANFTSSLYQQIQTIVEWGQYAFRYVLAWLRNLFDKQSILYLPSVICLLSFSCLFLFVFCWGRSWTPLLLCSTPYGWTSLGSALWNSSNTFRTPCNTWARSSCNPWEYNMGKYFCSPCDTQLRPYLAHFCTTVLRTPAKTRPVSIRSQQISNFTNMLTTTTRNSSALKVLSASMLRVNLVAQDIRQSTFIHGFPSKDELNQEIKAFLMRMDANDDNLNDFVKNFSTFIERTVVSTDELVKRLRYLQRESLNVYVCSTVLLYLILTALSQ